MHRPWDELNPDAVNAQSPRDDKGFRRSSVFYNPQAQAATHQTNPPAKSRNDIFNTAPRSRNDIFNTAPRSRNDIFNTAPRSRNDIFNTMPNSKADPYVYPLSSPPLRPLTSTVPVSRNDIFHVDHSVRKPAAQMTEKELEILKSSRYDTSCSMIVPDQANNHESVVFPVDTRLKRDERDFQLLLPVQAISAVKKQAEEMRSFHHLDEDQVSTISF
jgi:hypothetical protein